MATAVRPRAWIAATAAAAPAVSGPKWRATSAPWRAQPIATARPIPADAPVTRTTLFSSSIGAPFRKNGDAFGRQRERGDITLAEHVGHRPRQIGRASCRERVCQYV